MKNSIFFKFIAILLCAASVAAIALGGVGAIGVENYSLYNRTPAEELSLQLDQAALELASYHTEDYANTAYSGLSEEENDKLWPDRNWYYYFMSLNALEIRDGDGELLHAINTPDGNAPKRVIPMTVEYPVAVRKTVAHTSGLGQAERYDGTDEGLYATEFPLEETSVEPTTAPVTDVTMGLVISERAHIYESPDLDSDIVDVLNKDTWVAIYRQAILNGVSWGQVSGGWIELRCVAIEGQETDETSTNPMMAQVTEGSPHVHSAPSASSSVTANLEMGDWVEILELTTQDGVSWGRIEQGWIMLELVALNADTWAKAAETQTTAPQTAAGYPVMGTVIANTLNVRPYAVADGEIIEQLHVGDRVEILEQKAVNGSTWGRIEQGWINLGYVAIDDYSVELPLPEEIADLGEPLYYEDLGYQDDDYAVTYHVAYYQGPELEVSVWLEEDYYSGDMQLIQLLYTWRDQFIPLLLLGLAVFSVTFVYLCAAAGRTPAGDIRPAGLNRLPLDIYLIAAISLCVAFGAAIVLVLDRGGFDWQILYTVLGLGSLGIGLSTVGFFYCLSAQLKVKGRYWWHHSLTGWCVDKLLFILSKCLLPLGTAARGARALFRMLPLVWQWLATAAGMVVIPFFALLVCNNSYSDFATFFWCILFFLSLAADVALVCYGAYCYGKLLRGAKHMAQGDLHHKVPTRHLRGTFLDFAKELNSLGSAAQTAAQKQMKSERMKTELITNVSHDIKTPLTSIINFVDLLKKPHTEKEGAQYLDVLDRQSQRLKKLIDDLMEMSKASTGNLTVELEQVDAVEAVNQALGEFADKLARAQLVPVFRYPDAPVILRADGRLVWRVLSNVLSNAVKYALPDTRLYIDLNVMQGNAVLAIKNISREQLNVDAGELMERFVRGDASRNTEGSGLGLNIAKSLVELQRGQMHLMVDGDLFKVTIILPLY